MLWQRSKSPDDFPPLIRLDAAFKGIGVDKDGILTVAGQGSAQIRSLRASVSTVASQLFLTIQNGEWTAVVEMSSDPKHQRLAHRIVAHINSTN